MSFEVGAARPENLNSIELIWKGDEPQNFFTELKEHIEQHPQEKNFKIVWSDKNLTFNVTELIQYVKEKEINLELEYMGVNPEQKELEGEYQVKHKLAANELNYFKPQYNQHVHELTLELLPDELLEFSPDNPAYIELKKIIGNLGEGQKINISAVRSAVNFQSGIQLVNSIIEMKKAYWVSFQFPEATKESENINLQLENLYLSTRRKKGIHEIPLNNDNVPVAMDKKIRRAKQMLLQGKKMQAQTQRQYHHQHQHAQQQQNQQQNQQQLNQDIFQQRQAQINQQQKRLEQRQVQQLNEVDVKSLGFLIDKDSLKFLVTDKIPLEKVKRVWTNLVGPHHDKVVDPQARITHVPETTMRLILDHEEQFSFGVNFNDLPNGFNFTVHETKNNYGTVVRKSIFYFDKAILKSGAQRTDSPLSPQIHTPPSPIPSGDVGQLYPFYNKEHFDEAPYSEFIKQNQKAFKQIAPDSKASPEKQLRALIHLIKVEAPEIDVSNLPFKQLQFTNQNIQGLRSVLLKHGAETLVQLLSHLNKIYASGQYKLFKKTFLDKSNDWNSLVNQIPKRNGDLGAFAAMDYLITMPAEQKIWWQTLIEQHAQYNEVCDLMDLVNAHRYFFSELKKIDPDLILPIPCPIEGSNNIKLTYRRLLTLLENAQNPHEQIKHLEGLDYSMQGFTTALTSERHRPYQLITRAMDITPEAQLIEWSKYKKYLPTPPERMEGRQIKYVPEEGVDYNLPTKDGYRSTPYRYVKFQNELLNLAFDGGEAIYGATYYQSLRVNHDGNLEVIVEADSENPHNRKMDRNFVHINSLDDIDDLFLKRHNQIDYAINLADLYSIMERVNLPSSLQPYFYRYIGIQQYAFPYATYVQLVQEIDQSTQGSLLSKPMLLLMAICATGERVLQEGRNPIQDCQRLISLIKQSGVSTHNVESILENNYMVYPKPTIYEFTSLLKFSTNLPTLNILFKAAREHGVMVYDLINRFNLLQTKPTEADLTQFITFLNTIYRYPDHKKQILVYLASIIDVGQWSHLSDLVASLEDPGLTDDFLVQLAAGLRLINNQESSPIQIADALRLIDELKKEPNINKLVKEELIFLSKKKVPQLEFNCDDLSQKMTGFLLGMTQFTNELKEALDSLQDQLKDPDSYVDELLKKNKQPEANEQAEEVLEQKIDPNSEGQEASFFDLSKYKKYLVPIASELLDVFARKISLMISQLEQIKNEHSSDGIKLVLNSIQEIVSFIEDPLAHTQQEIPLPFIVRPLLNNFILGNSKKGMIESLNKHLIDILHSDITQSVQSLKINQRLQDKNDQQIHLGEILNRFLINYVPPLKGVKIAIELNESFRLQEETKNFLKALKNTFNENHQRNSFISFLYKRDYFSQYKAKFSNYLSLKNLTELMKSLPKMKNSEALLNVIFNVLNENNRVFTLSVLKNLQEKGAKLADNELVRLFEIGLADAHSEEQNNAKGKLDVLLEIHDLIPQNPSLFAKVIDLATQSELKDLTQLCSLLRENLPEQKDHLIAYVDKQLEDPTPGLQNLIKLKDLLTISNEKEAIIRILNKSAWGRPEETATMDEQVQLIKRLIELNALSYLADDLYRYNPAPGFMALQTAIAAPEPQIQQWVKDYELDPFGHRDRILNHYQTQGILEFTNEIKGLISEQKILSSDQQKLIDAATYILSIGNDYPLTIHGVSKPLNQFRRNELVAYFKQCRDRSEDESARIEGLAVLCEVFFRSTGKYPYPSQIVSVLCGQVYNGNLLLQIQTGQGKTTTLALMAAMAYAFGDESTHVTVCSRNKLLTERDYQECKEFYNYLNIPVALVRAGTSENHYEKPTVVYSTASDKSLYDSRLKIVEHVELPKPAQQVIVCDEVDAEFFDNKNAFNFSESKEDPFINPLEWVYPLTNEFIELPEFKNLFVTEKEDIILFRNYLKAKEPEFYKIHEQRLSNEKLSQLLDAACLAKQLKEKDDFIVRRREREVHGKKQIISEAHVIEGHIEDKEATLSYGVQQALHARLNKEYQESISQFKAGNEMAMPPFSCDNQIEAVDSQNSHSFFKKFGRIIGATGTAGSRHELDEVQATLAIDTMLDIPPRKQSRLHYLPTLFCDDKTSFWFSGNNQLKAIIRALDKARQQPVMVSCASIEQAELWSSELEKRYPGKVQVIHAINADDPIEFDKMVDKAKNAGQITVVTPLAGRGVDIKTPKASMQGTANEKKLSQLAERLLVIETHLERYRNRRQLQGRSARDGKAGETLGIFNLDTIAQEHGLSPNIKNRKDKLNLLEELMEKMDDEAALERQISTQVRSLIIYFENQFELEISKQPALKEVLRQEKTLFIERAERMWNEILADLDSDGQYPNPYVRYTEGRLNHTLFDDQLTKYQKQLEDLYKEQCSDCGLEVNPVVDNEQIYRYKKLQNGVEVVAERPLETVKKKSRTDTYLELNREENIFKDRLQQSKRVNDSLNEWVRTYRASSEQEKQITAINADIPALLVKQTYAVSLMHSMKKNITKPDQLDLLTYYQLALNKDEINISPAEHLELNTALTELIAHQLTLLTKTPNLNSQDKSLLHQMIRLNETDGIVERTLQDRIHLLIKATTLYEPLFSNPEIQSSVTRIKDFAVTVAAKARIEKEPGDHIQHELLKAMVKSFLEQTILRLQNAHYQRKHPGANVKIGAIQEFINSLDALPNSPKWFTHIKHRLDPILAQNTGFNLRSQTQSQREWQQLQKQVERVCLSEKPPFDIKNFEERLDNILANLEVRAHGFFKNKELYKDKIEHLKRYIDQAKKSISEYPDSTVAVRLLRDQVMKDGSLTANTSRSIFSTNRVQVVKDINELTEEFLKKAP